MYTDIKTQPLMHLADSPFKSRIQNTNLKSQATTYNTQYWTPMQYAHQSTDLFHSTASELNIHLLHDLHWMAYN